MKHQGIFLSQSSSREKLLGFTLLELLVVIAIIGLLVTITWVSLGGARERAKIAKTMQWSQSLHSFLGADAVGVWNFNETSGDTVLDASGNGNDGTIYGASRIRSEISGNALSFDGNDYVEIPYSQSINLPANNETVILWVKHNNSSNIFYQDSGWSRRLFGAAWTFTDANNNYYSLSAAGSVDNKWHMVGYTISDRTIKSYVDGELVDTKVTSNDVCCAASSVWRFGRVCGGASCDLYYQGLIDEVRIYARALTSAEIQKHYAQGATKRGLTNLTKR